jgi:predicted RNase H-like HicB family nuclease
MSRLPEHSILDQTTFGFADELAGHACDPLRATKRDPVTPLGVALLSTSRDGNVTTVDMTYRVTLVQSEEGFAVWCDDLPGCNSQGQTREEALTNIKSAISEYLAAQPEIEERFNVKIEREEVTV